MSLTRKEAHEFTDYVWDVKDILEAEKFEEILKHEGISNDVVRELIVSPTIQIGSRLKKTPKETAEKIQTMVLASLLELKKANSLLNEFTSRLGEDKPRNVMGFNGPSAEKEKVH